MEGDIKGKGKHVGRRKYRSKDEERKGNDEKKTHKRMCPVCFISVCSPNALIVKTRTTAM